MRLRCDEKYYLTEIPASGIIYLCSHLLPTSLLLSATSRSFSINSFIFPALLIVYIITNPSHPAPTIPTSAPTTPYLLLAPVSVADELDFVVDAENVADVGGEEAAEAADAEEVALADEELEPVVATVEDVEEVLDPDAEVDLDDADDADDSLVSLVWAALAAVTTPPCTF